MRLLKTSDLQFEEHHGSEIPEYAILSHRWCEPELSYQDMCRIIEHGIVPHEPRTSSYHKIMNCRAQARRSGHGYIWADTCCIDKTSSAEYQEAINSMGQWYAESAICYAYLDDVDFSKLPDAPPRKFRHEVYNILQRSEWFTRGWTLQELIALQIAWIRNRETTCEEDMAYSLLGIFDLYMPLLYGEGRERAQRRLRQEVQKSNWIGFLLLLLWLQHI
ncbi:heterokaryon incompatibility protein-domain-containing protein [Microdochium bolleyi]|uniref:Heterokaryon incompatibility protein-domain-containing protein n=1 Tax=Microdochium bolleyi TaxID=196109 RepID=A0A136IIE9_9PEZI|nr:heterokaryon incompatibility protein-domain-containing protein [Microdochium bolleyi]